MCVLHSHSNLQLTGLWVFYQNEDDDALIHQKVIAGERPELPPFLQVNEHFHSKAHIIEQGLVDIMKKCWESNPSKRVDIFTVVSMLHHLHDKANRNLGNK